MNRMSEIRFAAGLAFPLLVTVLLMLPDELFVVSLFKAFLMQALLFLPLLAIFFLWKKWKGMAIGTVLSCLLLLLFMIPYLRSAQSDHSGKEEFVVAQFNLMRSNQSYGEVIEMIGASEADLVSVQEIDSNWLSKLKMGLAENYPWSYGLPDESGFYGVAVFSRFPADFSRMEMAGLENIEGTCYSPSGEVHFLSSHLATPTTPFNYKLRNHHLKQIAKWAEAEKEPVVTFGDYNAVPWDSNLKCLVENAGLVRASGGWLPTFPANLFALIPIDYVFFSNDFQCSSMEGKSIPGSDHKGVVARLCFTLHKSQSAEPPR